MSNDLVLPFPVLSVNSDDFVDGVSYMVEAIQWKNDRKLTISHVLTGRSFIAHLIKNKKAKFAVSLLYKSHAERKSIVFDEFHYDENTETINQEQTIDLEFSYAPEIMPFIVIKQDEIISANEQSGLTNFWQGETFEIPAFARIAQYSKLDFNSGSVSSLIWKDMDENYNDGSIKTVVSEDVGIDEQPIKVICAKDVYDELDRKFSGEIDIRAVIKKSIITQILCHVYAHMSKLSDKNSVDIHSGLLEHMSQVKEKTKQDWYDDDFNASLAATKMIPYAIKELNE